MFVGNKVCWVVCWADEPKWIDHKFGGYAITKRGKRNPYGGTKMDSPQMNTNVSETSEPKTSEPNPLTTIDKGEWFKRRM